MIPEFGLYALILALCLAVLQVVLPLVGTARGYQPWIRMARPLAYGQSFFILFSFGVLMYCFIVNDFSVAYVAQNSNTHLPLAYRIAAVWGAHEGSLLLWVSVLALWMIAVATFSKSLPREALARVLAVMAMISIGFLLFMLMTSDPFLRTLQNIPANGRDLNPMLQDPGLAIHPPMLYMGYVGFSVAFAFAIASLIGGRFDAAWARWTRPWTTAAWCFLTLGITLGSWWAYRVLGWGGWWFWDPVENASFLPWLTGTALIHSLSVTEKRGAFKSWTILLAICAFSLSLLGTFLVRSGVLTSVHAFAVDPTRGAFMLNFLLVVIGGSLLLYAWRGNQVKGTSAFQLLSRETILLSNNVILMVLMATILLGTLYPLVLQALDLGKISVGPPYFNAVFVPLLTVLVLFMGLGPLCQWHSMRPMELVKKIYLAIIIAVVLAIALPWIFASKETLYVVLGLSLAFWLMITLLSDVIARYRRLGKAFWKQPKSYYGMLFAHIGMAVCIIGVTLTSAYSVEKDVRMQPGQSVTVNQYQFRFEDVTKLKGPNYQGVSATFEVSKDNHPIAILQPQKRIFNVQQMAMSHAAFNVGLFRDLYVVLGEPIQGQAWAVRVYDKPFVRWIWAGGLLMMIGGLVALFDRRYRKRKELSA